MVIFVGDGPSPKYIQVPAALVERVRRSSTLLGVTIIVLSIVIGIAALPGAFMLATMENPLTFMLVGFVIIHFLFSLISGIIAIFGKACVASGQLDYVTGRSLFRMNVVFLVGTVLCTGASWLLMAAASAGSKSGFTLGLFAYLMLISVPAILTIVSVAGASRLVRGSPQVIQQYAWPQR